MSFPLGPPRSQRHGVLEGEDEKEDEVSLSGFETPKDEKKIKEGGKKDLNEKSMELMLKMMDSMQKMMLKKNGSPEVEMVRGAHLEVARLQEWSAESAPPDLGDWFITLDPVMGDLIPTSHAWCDLVMGEAKEWYKYHQTLSPLERVSHKPVPEPFVGCLAGWRRRT